MPADATQLQLFVCLSAALSADRTQSNNGIYFILWFFNRLLFQADEYKVPAQQQAVYRYAPSNLRTMITTADFKKQIAKPFGQEMRMCGFKGTGLEYRQETEEYFIAIYIDPSRWGGSCSAGFAVHPKQVNHDYYGAIDFQRLKTYQYEFKMSLAKEPNGPSWNYSDDQKANLEILAKIVTTIRKVAFPAIEQFKAKPSVVELFEMAELRQFHKNWAKRTGTFIATTKERFAWAAALMLERKNPRKAKEFAEWCLSQPDEGDEEWFGTLDLNRIIAANTGA